jgi:hypothetical protein
MHAERASWDAFHAFVIERAIDGSLDDRLFHTIAACRQSVRIGGMLACLLKRFMAWTVSDSSLVSDIAGDEKRDWARKR